MESMQLPKHYRTENRWRNANKSVKIYDQPLSFPIAHARASLQKEVCVRIGGDYYEIEVKKTGNPKKSVLSC